MAVYTCVSPRQCAQFLAEFQSPCGAELGRYVRHSEILDGVENSNFLVQTDKRELILTLYERRVRPGDLPFFLRFSAHLAQAGLPAPAPIPRKDHAPFGQLCGKPAALITKLPGESLREARITDELCRQTGALLARMHRAARDFPETRPNDLGIQGWPGLLNEAETLLAQKSGPNGRPNTHRPSAPENERNNALRQARALLDALQKRWPRKPSQLPRAVVHADLFADNVLVQNGEVRGVIDFYFACEEFLLYDLAVCHIAWCHDARGNFLPGRGNALVAGYESEKNGAPVQTAQLALFSAGAGLRFFLTRFLDTILTPEDGKVEIKDPEPILRAAEFHARNAGLL